MTFAEMSGKSRPPPLIGCSYLSTDADTISARRGRSTRFAATPWGLWSAILAISRASRLHRSRTGIGGPLFFGIDIQALPESVLASALEVFAGNGIHVASDKRNGYTPTPVVSHAFLTYNGNRQRAFAGGVATTPSHKPSENVGFEYKPPNGGTADTAATARLERRANALLEKDRVGLRRVRHACMGNSSCLRGHDYITSYVVDPNLAGV
jgi:phosphoglucomutase